MSATLRKRSEKSYIGELGGYDVEVFKCVGVWWGAVTTPWPKKYTLVQLRGPGLKEAAAAARQWIEEHPFSKPGD